MTMPTLRLRLLGDFSLLYNDQQVTNLNTTRLRSLLAYLVLHRDVPQQRQQTLLAATPTLIGRKQEWEALQEVWHAASTGEPRFVLVTGEAGIGKSRLAEEFLLWASQQGAVIAYLLIWTLFGLVAYPLALFAERLAGQSMWLMNNASRIGGALLVVAGLYQLSPLKHMCLSKCRTPLQFILGSWRDGYGGAFRMGFLHGAYCLGSCWFLFVLLFPLGIMNIAVMALLTALIYAEKSFTLGRQISQIAGVALIVYGVIVICVPAALPVVM